MFLYEQFNINKIMMNNTYHGFIISFFLNTMITITLFIILKLLLNFEIKILTTGHNFVIMIQIIVIIIKT